MRTADSLPGMRRAAFLAGLATLVLPCAAVQAQQGVREPSVAVAVQEPRAFGYVIGDRLEQRISLRAPAGLALDPRSLPTAGRTGLWLELAPPRLSSEKAGRDTLYRLTLDYQVINVAEQVRTIELPALDLVFTGKGFHVTADVDEWPVTIAPITPAFVLARAGLAEAQPDAPPTAADPAPYRRLTLLWVALIVALAAGMVAQRRGMPWLRRDARPFAWAARDIAKLSRLPPDQATYRRGLQRLHRAFDAAAGRAVFAERLQPLFAAHPELLRLRADIERFYADSQREFFGAHGGSANLGAVLALAQRCRDAEAAAARRPPAGDSAGPEHRPHAV